MIQSTAAWPAAGFVTSPALFGGGRQRRRFSGGAEAASAARAGTSAGAAGAASAGGLTALALVSWEGSGTDAVWVTNLLVARD
jgi:hypothetical protein